MERTRDRELPICVQAIIALSKLAGSEDVSALEEGEQTIMGHGRPPGRPHVRYFSCFFTRDVRRASLINLPVIPATLSPIMARTRDTDPIVRRLVYTHVLSRACSPTQAQSVSLTPAFSPLPSTKRSRVGRCRQWRGPQGEEGGEGVRGCLVDFLKLFDLVEAKIAEDVLVSVFTVREDVFHGIGFEGVPSLMRGIDDYWEHLTPGRAFLARVFVDHCVAQKDDARLENVLPVVTSLAFRIQAAYNDLLELIREHEADRLLREGMEDEDEERARREEELLDGEFVIGELLRLAVNLDYADEIGRRKMFQLVPLADTVQA
ncbi:hypothetical protein FOMPIDRAFT_114936 [Fomitopsis schrenkii]|uniref:Uncharacterized protein n=1 Tax=Fomitopsis schrenkii TaxID=2126942 RepID=S8DXW9_FOMSC|nr:hypothetical protein FOMPIDRAFT_114936 [Fomitopsis schrenkii]